MLITSIITGKFWFCENVNLQWITSCENWTFSSSFNQDINQQQQKGPYLKVLNLSLLDLLPASLGVKYQLTNWLFIHLERRLDQTCAGFSDHCNNGTTCDTDTNLCTTVNSKCYLYVIPGVLSTPSLCFWATLSLSLLHRSLLHVLICCGILSSCCNLSVSVCYVHLFPERAVVYRRCRSQGPLCWEPSATEDTFF